MRQEKPLPPTHSLSVYSYVYNKSSAQEWPYVKQWMQQNVFQHPTPANECQTIPFFFFFTTTHVTITVRTYFLNQTCMKCSLLRNVVENSLSQVSRVINSCRKQICNLISRHPGADSERYNSLNLSQANSGSEIRRAAVSDTVDYHKTIQTLRLWFKIRNTIS